MTSLGRFAGKTVIIFGAGSPVGLTVAAAFKAEGAQVIKAEIYSPAQTDAVVAAAVERFGAVDVLVTALAASSSPAIDLADLDDDDFDAVISTNLTGAFHCARAALPYLVLTRGAIVVLLEQLGPSAEIAAQAAAGAGVEIFVRSIAYQYGPQGVRANVVRANGGAPAARTLLDRVGTTQDAAHLVLFLASSDASYVTGAILPVDGGGPAVIGPRLA